MTLASFLVVIILIFGYKLFIKIYHFCLLKILHIFKTIFILNCFTNNVYFAFILIVISAWLFKCIYICLRCKENNYCTTEIHVRNNIFRNTYLKTIGSKLFFSLKWQTVETMLTSTLRFLRCHQRTTVVVYLEMLCNWAPYMFGGWY